jgi:hypothetical protein
MVPQTALSAVALETSGSLLSFSLLKRGRPAGRYLRFAALRHERLFWKIFPRRLARARLKIRDLDFVAVTRGHGRYTGIRFGLAIATSWCKAVGVPLFAPSVEELLRWQVEAAGRGLWKPAHGLLPQASALLNFALDSLPGNGVPSGGNPKPPWYGPARLPGPCYPKALPWQR